jgi:quercetin dioxygenase-like cupin family protein
MRVYDPILRTTTMPSVRYRPTRLLVRDSVPILKETYPCTIQFFGAGGLLAGAVASAQDPVKVDPKHYKVEFENSQVRVLRINYGPHEKSVMHHHPGSVAVYLSDGQARMTTPDGKSQNSPIKAGVAEWTPAGSHQPENVGDKPFELILVELKTQKAPAK